MREEIDVSGENEGGAMLFNLEGGFSQRVKSAYPNHEVANFFWVESANVSVH